MRDKRKRWAQNQIKYQVYLGNLPRVKMLTCFHCGNPARDYDHFAGHDHPFHVLPVCRSCHFRIEWARGEFKRSPLQNKNGAKLTRENVLFIRRLPRKPGKLLAEKFGVSITTIYRAFRRVSHKDYP